MSAWAWILIAIGIVIVVGLLVTMAIRQRRTTTLRQRFGPEYDRTMRRGDGRRTAEADLRERQKQRDQLDIKPLPESTRSRFAAEWRELQEWFVDQPSNSVVAADGLVYRVMEARGYPMNNFESQAKLISVDHPQLVENYRLAHGICERARSKRATTEDLRAALLRYRSLFDDLLQPEEAGGQSVRAPEQAGGQSVRAPEQAGGQTVRADHGRRAVDDGHHREPSTQDGLAEGEYRPDHA